MSENYWSEYMTVPELKKILRQRGLKVAGRKSDLITRLQDDDAGKMMDNDEEEDDDDDEDEITSLPDLGGSDDGSVTDPMDSVSSVSGSGEEESTDDEIQMQIQETRERILSDKSYLEDIVADGDDSSVTESNDDNVVAETNRDTHRVRARRSLPDFSPEEHSKQASLDFDQQPVDKNGQVQQWIQKTTYSLNSTENGKLVIQNGSTFTPYSPAPSTSSSSLPDPHIDSVADRVEYENTEQNVEDDIPCEITEPNFVDDIPCKKIIVSAEMLTGTEEQVPQSDENAFDMFSLDEFSHAHQCVTIQDDMQQFARTGLAEVPTVETSVQIQDTISNRNIKKEYMIKQETKIKQEVPDKPVVKIKTEKKSPSEAVKVKCGMKLPIVPASSSSSKSPSTLIVPSKFSSNSGNVFGNTTCNMNSASLSTNTKSTASAYLFGQAPALNSFASFGSTPNPSLTSTRSTFGQQFNVGNGFGFQNVFTQGKDLFGGCGSKTVEQTRMADSHGKEIPATSSEPLETTSERQKLGENFNFCDGGGFQNLSAVGKELFASIRSNEQIEVAENVCVPEREGVTEDVNIQNVTEDINMQNVTEYINIHKVTEDINMQPVTENITMQNVTEDINMQNVTEDINIQNVESDENSREMPQLTPEPSFNWSFVDFSFSDLKNTNSSEELREKALSSNLTRANIFDQFADNNNINKGKVPVDETPISIAEDRGDISDSGKGTRFEIIVRNNFGEVVVNNTGKLSNKVEENISDIEIVKSPVNVTAGLDIGHKLMNETADIVAKNNMVSITDSSVVSTTKKHSDKIAIQSSDNLTGDILNPITEINTSVPEVDSNNTSQLEKMVMDDFNPVGIKCHKDESSSSGTRNTKAIQIDAVEHALTQCNGIQPNFSDSVLIGNDQNSMPAKCSNEVVLKEQEDVLKEKVEMKNPVQRSESHEVKGCPENKLEVKGYLENNLEIKSYPDNKLKVKSYPENQLEVNGYSEKEVQGCPENQLQVNGSPSEMTFSDNVPTIPPITRVVSLSVLQSQNIEDMELTPEHSIVSSTTMDDNLISEESTATKLSEAASTKAANTCNNVGEHVIKERKSVMLTGVSKDLELCSQVNMSSDFEKAPLPMPPQCIYDWISSSFNRSKGTISISKLKLHQVLCPIVVECCQKARKYTIQNCELDNGSVFMQFATLKLFQEAENALNQYFADDKYVDITCPKGQAKFYSLASSSGLKDACYIPAAFKTVIVQGVDGVTDSEIMDLFPSAVYLHRIESTDDIVWKNCPFSIPAYLSDIAVLELDKRSDVEDLMKTSCITEFYVDERKFTLQRLRDFKKVYSYNYWNEFISDLADGSVKQEESPKLSFQLRPQKCKMLQDMFTRLEEKILKLQPTSKEAVKNDAKYSAIKGVLLGADKWIKSIDKDTENRCHSRLSFPETPEVMTAFTWKIFLMRKNNVNWKQLHVNKIIEDARNNAKMGTISTKNVVTTQKQPCEKEDDSKRMNETQIGDQMKILCKEHDSSPRKNGSSGADIKTLGTRSSVLGSSLSCTEAKQVKMVSKQNVSSPMKKRSSSADIKTLGASDSVLGSFMSSTEAKSQRKLHPAVQENKAVGSSSTTSLNRLTGVDIITTAENVKNFSSLKTGDKDRQLSEGNRDNINNSKSVHSNRQTILRSKSAEVDGSQGRKGIQSKSETVVFHKDDNVNGPVNTEKIQNMEEVLLGTVKISTAVSTKEKKINIVCDSENNKESKGTTSYKSPPSTLDTSLRQKCESSGKKKVLNETRIIEENNNRFINSLLMSPERSTFSHNKKTNEESSLLPSPHRSGFSPKKKKCEENRFQGSLPPPPHRSVFSPRKKIREENRLQSSLLSSTHRPGFSPKKQKGEEKQFISLLLHEPRRSDFSPRKKKGEENRLQSSLLPSPHRRVFSPKKKNGDENRLQSSLLPSPRRRVFSPRKKIGDENHFQSPLLPSPKRRFFSPKKKKGEENHFQSSLLPSPRRVFSPKKKKGEEFRLQSSLLPSPHRRVFSPKKKKGEENRFQSPLLPSPQRIFSPKKKKGEENRIQGSLLPSPQRSGFSQKNKKGEENKQFQSPLLPTPHHNVFSPRKKKGEEKIQNSLLPSPKHRSVSPKKKKVSENTLEDMFYKLDSCDNSSSKDDRLQVYVEVFNFHDIEAAKTYLERFGNIDDVCLQEDSIEVHYERKCDARQALLELWSSKHKPRLSFKTMRQKHVIPTKPAAIHNELKLKTSGKNDEKLKTSGKNDEKLKTNGKNDEISVKKIDDQILADNIHETAASKLKLPDKTKLNQEQILKIRADKEYRKRQKLRSLSKSKMTLHESRNKEKDLSTMLRGKFSNLDCSNKYKEADPRKEKGDKESAKMEPTLESLELNQSENARLHKKEADESKTREGLEERIAAIDFRLSGYSGSWGGDSTVANLISDVVKDTNLSVVIGSDRKRKVMCGGDVTNIQSYTNSLVVDKEKNDKINSEVPKPVSTSSKLLLNKPVPQNNVNEARNKRVPMNISTRSDEINSNAIDFQGNVQTGVYDGNVFDKGKTVCISNLQIHPSKDELVGRKRNEYSNVSKFQGNVQTGVYDGNVFDKGKTVSISNLQIHPSKDELINRKEKRNEYSNVSKFQGNVQTGVYDGNVFDKGKTVSISNLQIHPSKDELINRKEKRNEYSNVSKFQGNVQTGVYDGNVFDKGKTVSISNLQIHPSKDELINRKEKRNEYSNVSNVQGNVQTGVYDGNIKGKNDSISNLQIHPSKDELINRKRKRKENSNVSSFQGNVQTGVYDGNACDKGKNDSISSLQIHPSKEELLNRKRKADEYRRLWNMQIASKLKDINAPLHALKHDLEQLCKRKRRSDELAESESQAKEKRTVFFAEQAKNTATDPVISTTRQPAVATSYQKSRSEWMADHTSFSKSQGQSVPVSKNRPPEIPVTYNRSPEIPVSKNRPPEIPVTYNRSPEIPVSKNRPPEIPVTYNRSPEIPVTKNRPPEIPVSKNRSPEIPVTKNRSLEIPITKNRSLEIPGAKNRSPEIPVTKNSSVEIPVTKNSSLEIPVTKNRSPEIPVTKNRSLETTSEHSRTDGLKYKNEKSRSRSHEKTSYAKKSDLAKRPYHSPSSSEENRRTASKSVERNKSSLYKDQHYSRGQNTKSSRDRYRKSRSRSSSSRRSYSRGRRARSYSRDSLYKHRFRSSSRSQSPSLIRRRRSRSRSRESSWTISTNGSWSPKRYRSYSRGRSYTPKRSSKPEPAHDKSNNDPNSSFERYRSPKRLKRRSNRTYRKSQDCSPSFDARTYRKYTPDYARSMSYDSISSYGTPERKKKGKDTVIKNKIHSRVKDVISRRVSSLDSFMETMGIKPVAAASNITTSPLNLQNIPLPQTPQKTASTIAPQQPSTDQLLNAVLPVIATPTPQPADYSQPLPTPTPQPVDFTQPPPTPTPQPADYTQPPPNVFQTRYQPQNNYYEYFQYAVPLETYSATATFINNSNVDTGGVYYGAVPQPQQPPYCLHYQPVNYVNYPYPSGYQQQ